MTSRRKFLQHVSAASLATPVFASALRAAPAAQSQTEWPIAIFEKVFEGLSYEELADAMEKIGADGVEATIRPGGHIEPAAAKDEVPKMSAALKARGKRIVIAATHVGSVDAPQSESLLRTLASEGVTHYRMNHYRYDLTQPIMPQLANFTAMARDLAAMNKEVGIQGLYQNHSGATAKRGYVGALGFDVATMLDGIDPDHLGLAMDTRHLCKDTGSSWPVALAACKPHIRSIYVKDGTWKGERGDQYENVPLDTGFVNETVFQSIRAGVKPMPLAIHMEWLGYRVFPKDEIPQAIEACQRDIKTLRRWLAA